MRRGVSGSSMLSFRENLEVMGSRLLCRARKQGDEGKGRGGVDGGRGWS